MHTVEYHDCAPSRRLPHEPEKRLEFARLQDVLTFCREREVGRPRTQRTTYYIDWHRLRSDSTGPRTALLVCEGRVSKHRRRSGAA